MYDKILKAESASCKPVRVVKEAGGADLIITVFLSHIFSYSTVLWREFVLSQ